MSLIGELREREWQCFCASGNVRSAACVKCLRCGAEAPNPPTLGDAALALQTYDRALETGQNRIEAMREALERDRGRKAR